MPLALFAAFATVLLWASAFPFIGLALRSFDPIALASLRFAVAGILLGGWLVWKRPSLPKIKDGLRFLLCAAIGIALYNILLNSGQTTVSPGAASFIINTVPVITAILAIFFLKERFGIWAWVGTGISLLGVGLIASGQTGGLSFGAGTTLVLAAALCQAAYFVLQRPLIPKYGAPVCASIVMILGGFCLAPWLPSALVQACSASTESFFAVLYLGIFPAAAGYATWTFAQQAFGASRASNFLYLVPFVATALAIPIVGEWPTLLTVTGGALAIIGVIVVNTIGRETKTA